MGLKPGEECYQCFRNGFTDYTRRGSLGSEHLSRYLELIYDNLSREIPPPLAGAEAWALLRTDSLNGTDLFADEKSLFTGKMLSVYQDLKNRFLASDNPAAEALSAGAWCNLLDVGQGKPLPEISDLVKLFTKPLASDERKNFLEKLDKADTLLILGDNAGETVLDRLFLELSGFSGRRYYMTRENPVMNDALISDAIEAGLHHEAKLISSGTDLPSVIPEMLQGNALTIYNKADLILAKGQGNLEGLFGLNDPRVYHSFVVKCPVVSRATGVESGNGVFRRFVHVEV